MGKFRQQEDSDDNGKMDVQEKKQPIVRKLARKRRIAKLRDKQGRAMVAEKNTERSKKAKTKVVIPLLAKKDEKKLEVFAELKKQNLNTNTNILTKMSKGKKRRFAKNQRVLFRKTLDARLTQRKTAGISMDDINKELNNINPNESALGASKHKSASIQSKSKIANEQVERMRQILNYAEFQKNPLASIKTHLLTSLKLRK